MVDSQSPLSQNEAANDENYDHPWRLYRVFDDEFASVSIGYYPQPKLFQSTPAPSSMVNRGTVSTADLRDVLADVEGTKPTQRLMAAINYLEEDGATMEEIAQRYGYTAGWLSRWLSRFERLESEPFEAVVYDEERSGRPPALAEQEKQRFKETVQEPPDRVGLDAPAWSVPLARNYLDEEFDVEYSTRHVRRLLREAGLSWTKARPEFYKSDERAAKAETDGLKKSATTWTTGTGSSQ